MLEAKCVLLKKKSINIQMESPAWMKYVSFSLLVLFTHILGGEGACSTSFAKKHVLHVTD